MINILISIFAFLIAIGVLIAFHEFGHFYIARRFGIKVLRFSIGFGKPLWTYYDKQGTEYVIAAFPLGGYVKLLEEPPEPSSGEEDRSFGSKSVWVRIAVVFAGPFFNIIFAILAYWLMFMIGITGTAPIIGDVIPNSIAMQAGLKANDEIVRVNGHKTPTWNAVNIAVLKHLGERDNLAIQVKGDGNDQIKVHKLDLSNWHIDIQTEQPLISLGLMPYRPSIPAIVDSVVAQSPAAKAGLQKGDRILAIDNQVVNDWKDLIKALEDKANRKTAVTLLRNNNRITVQLTPVAIGYQKQGYLGIQFPAVEIPKKHLRVQRYPIFTALTAALVKTWQVTVLTLALLWKIITGKLSLKVMSGPIGIAQGAGMSVSLGLSYYLDFLALISVSLAILNVLPIPMLDGGYLLFYIIEIFRGKPLSLRVQLLWLRIGLIFLVSLMFIVVINDLMRLFYKSG